MLRMVEITSTVKRNEQNNITHVTKTIMTQLNAAERSIALTNTHSHGPAVRELCAFLEAQTDPRPAVLEAFRVMVRATIIFSSGGFGMTNGSLVRF